MDLLGHLINQKLIRKNHAQSYPSSIVYFDTETKREERGSSELHRMKLAWACRVERRPSREKDTLSWHFFNKPFPLCRWIESLPRSKRPVWIFSHNLFFDFQAMDFFLYFTSWDWKLDFVYENQLSYIIVIRKGDRVIKGISTTNYFDTSLEEIGKMVGLRKGKVDFDKVDDETLSAYCKRDVEILKLAMERYFEFIQHHDLGKFGMTKAAQAFNAYRHRFMTERIEVHREEALIDLEKECYMGGRTECFFIGKVKRGPFTSLDINSMYPFVMRRESYPCKFIAYHENYWPERLPKDLTHFDACAECLIETERPRYAVRSKGKIIFPVGRFKVFLCTGGLLSALQAGELRAIVRIAFYKSANLFESYVNYFYDLKRRYKKSGNQTYHELVKKFLNSLYGKFAQYRPVSDWIDSAEGEAYYRLDSYDVATGEKQIEYKLMNRYVCESGRELGLNSFIAISAHITEYARLLLDDIISGIGRDRVLYCDTDSIKIRSSDLGFIRHPVDPERIGALKNEGEETALKILGPKSYITNKGVKLKGIPKKAVEVEPGTFEYTSFPRQASHMREKIISGFKTRKVRKTLWLVYDKGVVNPDGTVSALRLSEF